MMSSECGSARASQAWMTKSTAGSAGRRPRRGATFGGPDLQGTPSRRRIVPIFDLRALRPFPTKLPDPTSLKRRALDGGKNLLGEVGGESIELRAAGRADAFGQPLQLAPLLSDERLHLAVLGRSYLRGPKP